jgi:hypothetical protein
MLGRPETAGGILLCLEKLAQPRRPPNEFRNRYVACRRPRTHWQRGTADHLIVAFPTLPSTGHADEAIASRRRTRQD